MPVSDDPLHTTNNVIESISKTKQSKSRNGCLTCKAKRLKCDETKPICSQCIRRNVACGGYKKDFKWRPFGESYCGDKPNMRPRSKQHCKTPGDIKGLRPSTLGNSKPDTTSPPLHNSSSSLSSEFSSCDTDAKRGTRQPTSDTHNGNSKSLQSDSTYPMNNAEYESHEETGNSVAGMPVVSAWLAPRPSQTLSVAVTPLSQRSKTDLEQDIVTYSRISPNYPAFQADAPKFYSLPQPQISLQSECDDWATAFSGLFPSSSANSAMGSPLSSRQDSLGKALMNGASREGSANSTKRCLGSSQEDYHFTNKPTENAWHTLIMPLTQKCEALYHAAKALACFQESHKQSSLKEEGLVHERYANQKLACEIDGFTNISAVATSLLLASLEPWEEGIAPANKHLKGAKLLINEALRGQFRTASVGIEYTRLKVLYNTWLCLDVIFRLTCLDDRELGDFTEASTMIPCNSVYDNNLDPLGGCIPSLFPIIGQGAELIHWIRSGAVTSIQMVPQALKIWLMLEKWSPSAATMIARKRDPYSLEILRIAEAYRFSAFLFISQAVPELASPPATHLAGRVLEHVAAVHVNPKTAMLQIFPLLAASSEVIDIEGRNWIIARWKAIAGVRPDLSVAVGRCSSVIDEVWRRRDGFEAQRCNTLAAMGGGFDLTYAEVPPTSIFTPMPTLEPSLQQQHQQPLPPYTTSSSNSCCYGDLNSDDCVSTVTTNTNFGTATASTAATPITPATPATPVSPVRPGSAYTFPGPQVSQMHGLYQNGHARPFSNSGPTGADGASNCYSQDPLFCSHSFDHHYIPYYQHQHYHRQHQRQHRHQQRTLLDQAYTVCGQLHWIQIMREWGWDGFCILPWE